LLALPSSQSVFLKGGSLIRRAPEVERFRSGLDYVRPICLAPHRWCTPYFLANPESSRRLGAGSGVGGLAEEESAGGVSG